MADRTDFSEDEWRLLLWSPYLAALGSAAADLTAVSLVKEYLALAPTLKRLGQPYGENRLVQAVLRDEKTLKDEASRLEVQSLPFDSPMALFVRVARIVERQAASQEAYEFKQFLYRVAEKTASASGERFLDSGEGISAREYDFLANLAEALGL